jgi:peptide/nickel transport system permease protein
MTTYVIRRLLQGLVVLIIVSLLIFLVMRFLAGDPAMLYVSESQFQQMTEEQLKALRAQFGLDRSLPEQYVSWAAGIIHGDLGTSIMYRGVRVSSLLADRIPITLNLGILSVIISVILGILAGLVCALRRGGWLDTAVTSLANIGISVPEFWLAVLLIYGLGLKMGWLPIQGYTPPTKDFALNVRQLIMPVMCLAVVNFSGTARMTRSSILEVLRQDYVRTALSKGLKEWLIVTRHIMKNGLIPVVTMLGSMST